MYQTYGGPSHSRYQDTRVTTASQPDLHLMLLEGSVRFGRQAQLLWSGEGQSDESDRLLDRTLAIVEELVRGVTGRGTDESQRLEEEYAFAYRNLAQSRVNGDAAALAAGLSVLAFHCETWKLVCERLKASEGVVAGKAPQGEGPHINFRTAVVGNALGSSAPASGSFSFEA